MEETNYFKVFLGRMPSALGHCIIVTAFDFTPKSSRVCAETFIFCLDPRLKIIHNDWKRCWYDDVPSELLKPQLIEKLERDYAETLVHSFLYGHRDEYSLSVHTGYDVENLVPAETDTLVLLWLTASSRPALEWMLSTTCSNSLKEHIRFIFKFRDARIIEEKE